MSADEARKLSEVAKPGKEPTPVMRMLRVARREVPIELDLELGDEVRIQATHDGETIVDVKTFIGAIDERLHDDSGRPTWIKRVYVPKLRSSR